MLKTTFWGRKTLRNGGVRRELCLPPLATSRYRFNTCWIATAGYIRRRCRDGLSMRRMKRTTRARSLALCQDGTAVLEGGYDRTATLYSLTGGTQSRAFKSQALSKVKNTDAHDEAVRPMVRQVRLSADSVRLAMGTNVTWVAAHAMPVRARVRWSAIDPPLPTSSAGAC
jgi:WD40 repeat protein